MPTVLRADPQSWSSEPRVVGSPSVRIRKHGVSGVESRKSGRRVRGVSDQSVLSQNLECGLDDSVAREPTHLESVVVVFARRHR